MERGLLMTTATQKNDAIDQYFELVRRFPLRPIRSDKELNAAVKMVDSLLDCKDLTPAESDYLEVLGDLIEQYETEAHPIAPVSDSAMLHHLIEARGVSQTEVARATQIANSTISEVLSGHRTLNREHIAKLSAYFNVSPGVFVF
jgi:HTH-type transcriptional regulator / antitoxin HigA